MNAPCAIIKQIKRTLLWWLWVVAVGGGEGGDDMGLVAVTNMVVVAAVEARGG
ncbi:hypothetical protein Tco_0377384, partial [Tanacetum coccineum]